MRRRSRRGETPRLIAATLWLALFTISAGAFAQADADEVNPPQLGVAPGDAFQAAQLAELSGSTERQAPWLLLETDWATAGGPGATAWNWGRLEADIAEAARRGYRVYLVLDWGTPAGLPGGLPRVDVMGSLESWQDFAVSAVRRFGDAVDAIQIGRRLPSGSESIEHYQLMMKNTALAIGAEAERQGIEVRLAQAASGADRSEEQQQLWERGSAAYVGILPLALDATNAESEMAFLREMLGETLLHPPASQIWAIGAPAPAGDGAALALTALASGAEVAFVAPADPATALPALLPWFAAAHELLATGFAPAPLGNPRVKPRAGRPEGRPIARFLREDFSTLLFYGLPGARESLAADRLIVDSNFIKNTRVHDFVAGETLRMSASPLPDGSRGRSVRVHRGPLPLALQYDQALPPDLANLPAEELETRRSRELTAEEIIARHQQVARVQTDRLERWIADARVDLHLRLAQAGGTFDISIGSTYYWERGKPLEWEQTGYLINGNQVNWREFPEIPTIQPEKVVSLPLDLTLDKTYSYRSAGRDRVRGREAYVLVFRPTVEDADVSLYRGRVWIDTETFELLRTSVVQTGLEPPVLSNEEVNRYEERLDDDGHGYQLITFQDGQQTWNLGGRTFVVQREVYFDNYRINPSIDDFESRKTAAYDSDNKILRDTDEGFRYMRKQSDGTRELITEDDTGQLFAAFGAFSNSTGDVNPIAGVNYFNYDLWDRNIQANAFFAGAFFAGTMSKPDIFNGNADLTLDLRLFAIEFEERFFVGDEQIDEETIDRRPQELRLRLGYPFGQFFKLNAIGALTYREFTSNSDADDAIDDFNLAEMMAEEGGGGPARTLRQRRPETHFETRGQLQLEFNRRGLSVIATGGYFNRSEWEEFGLFEERDQTFVTFDAALDDFVASQAEPVLDDFTRWNVSVFKEWYFKSFQKVRLGLDYLDGNDLDRYSRYDFGFFGDEGVWGFSGSGVRFDQGLIYRAGYSFNIFDAIRLDVAVDHARVDNDFLQTDDQAFTGAGLSGSFIGPWKTVINFNFGYAIDSDIPDLEDQTEFLFTVFKLF